MTVNASTLTAESAHAKDLPAAIKALEAESPELGVYFHYLFDALEPLAQDSAYRRDPQLIEYCFGEATLQEDINETVHHIRQNISPEKYIPLLQNLFATIQDEPVYAYVFAQICEALGVIVSKTHNGSNTLLPPSIPRFHAPNLIFSPREMENFYRTCGLVPDSSQGKGSHVKWIDSTTGLFSALFAVSDQIWLKNNIRQMLQNGFPVERIKMACDKLHIEFSILSH